MGNATGSGLSSDAASVNAGIGANLAARLRYMKDKNNKAALAGVNVESKITAANDLMKSMGSKYSGGASGSSSSVASTNSSPNLMNSDLKDSKSNENPVTPVNQTNNDFQQFNNSQITTSSSNQEQTSDSTGLNDDDKEKLLVIVQNNKEQFQPNEEDGIFKVVSKAYVRNLDRILIRKKKIETENSNLK